MKMMNSARPRKKSTRASRLCAAKAGTTAIDIRLKTPEASSLSPQYLVNERGRPVYSRQRWRCVGLPRDEVVRLRRRDDGRRLVATWRRHVPIHVAQRICNCG